MSNSPAFSWNQARAHSVGVAIFGGIQLAAWARPALIDTAFCEPAARLSALFLGAPLLLGEDGALLIEHPAIDVAVVRSCSGFGFFALLAALLGGLAAQHHAPRRWRALLREWAWLLPAAYAVTLLANTARIVCAVHARVAAPHFVPADFHDAIHLAVGVAIFVTVLLTTWIFTLKHYERHL